MSSSIQGGRSSSRRAQQELRRQPSAAFGTTALQDETPGLGRHPGTESVRTCALDFAGLVCAFHGLFRDPEIQGGCRLKNGP